MQPTHLVILIHGLYGTPLNLKAVAEELVSLSLSRSSNDEDGGQQSTSSASTFSSSKPNGVNTHVLNVKSNEGVHTWDGIDVCAHRVAEEVSRVVGLLLLRFTLTQGQGPRDALRCYR